MFSKEHVQYRDEWEQYGNFRVFARFTHLSMGFVEAKSCVVQHSPLNSREVCIRQYEDAKKEAYENLVKFVEYLNR